MEKSEKITREDVLKLLCQSSVYGNLGLFIGAGMSMAILNDEWKKVALSWKELIYESAAKLGVDLKEDINTEGLSYPEIATEIAKTYSIKEGINYKKAIRKLKETIADLTSWYPESEERTIYSKILEDIDPNWIITTNYDLIIECILTGKCQSLGPDDQLISPQNLIPVYHLHGIRTNPDSIIISQEDYISLFRPNQYRQQKLSLSIKESTTLIVGYGLGDVNVLTAVDWTKNVYSNQKIIYPHDIVQLLYKDDPKKDPYRDRNDILIIEFNNLQEILIEIAKAISDAMDIDKIKNAELKEINDIFKNPSKEHVAEFIDSTDFRKTVIESISHNDVKLISGFLELFSKSIDETWKRAAPKGAFYAYDENLKILLDVIENIQLKKIPPALLESVVYNLYNLNYYIGDSLGKSRSAYQTWNNRKSNIPADTLLELKNIAWGRNYYGLVQLLKN